MSDNERHDLLSLRRLIENYLEQTQAQIADYSPTANDEDFRFLIRKAIYFHEMIDKLNNDLTEINDGNTTE